MGSKGEGVLRLRMSVPALLSAVSLLLAACGSSGSTGASPSPSGPVKVGMALAAPKNDGGFAQAHYQGLQQAEKDLGIKGSLVEQAVSPDQRVNALTSLAQDNQLVIGVGGEFAQAGVQVAPQFPKVTFVIVQGETAANAPNLHVYGVREGVPAYIAGVVLAKLTKTHKAGFIGGEQIPPATQASDAFKAGLQSVDPTITLQSTIVGSFNDPQKGAAAASAQLANGADVFYGYLAAGFPGVLQAIKDSKKDAHAASNIFPRCDQATFVVGDSILNAAADVVGIIKDFKNKAIPAQPVYHGVEVPDIQRFELCPGYTQYSDLVKTTTDGINDGSIKLPAGV